MRNVLVAFDGSDSSKRAVQYLIDFAREHSATLNVHLLNVQQPPIVAFPDETCRMAAERMAHAGVGRLPIVERAQSDRLVGIVSRSDLLKARTRWIDLEERRERLFRLRLARREKGALKAARPAR